MEIDDEEGKYIISPNSSLTNYQRLVPSQQKPRSPSTLQAFPPSPLVLILNYFLQPLASLRYLRLNLVPSPILNPIITPIGVYFRRNSTDSYTGGCSIILDLVSSQRLTWTTLSLQRILNWKRARYTDVYFFL
jgi:hypothetical protein